MHKPSPTKPHRQWPAPQFLRRTCAVLSSQYSTPNTGLFAGHAFSRLHSLYTALKHGFRQLANLTIITEHQSGPPNVIGFQCRRHWRSVWQYEFDVFMRPGLRGILVHGQKLPADCDTLDLVMTWYEKFLFCLYIQGQRHDYFMGKLEPHHCRTRS